jgi:hypothetical protein
MRKFFRMGIPVSGAIGALVAAFALYVGFQDNSQGEFFDVQTGAVEVRHALWFFVEDLIVVTVAALLLLGILALFLKVLRALVRKVSAHDAR